MRKQYYVYILSSLSRTLYIGVTNNLQARHWQHRNLSGPGFAAKYHVNRLVHYEIYADSYTAISREKQLKGWRREKKLSLIESQNPDWHDLSLDWEPATPATQPVE